MFSRPIRRTISTCWASPPIHEAYVRRICGSVPEGRIDYHPFTQPHLGPGVVEERTPQVYESDGCARGQSEGTRERYVQYRVLVAVPASVSSTWTALGTEIVNFFSNMLNTALASCPATLVGSAPNWARAAVISLALRTMRGVVGLDQRLRFERVTQVHQLVGELIARCKLIPTLPTNDQRVAPERLPATVESEALQIDASEAEADLLESGRGPQVYVALDRSRKNDVFVQTSGRIPSGERGTLVIARLKSELVLGSLHREA